MPVLDSERRSPSSVDTAACHKCKFWAKGEDRSTAEVGLCHRAAPQQTGWPATGAMEWCGEFKPTKTSSIRIALSFAQLVLAALVIMLLIWAGILQMLG